MLALHRRMVAIQAPFIMIVSISGLECNHLSTKNALDLFHYVPQAYADETLRILVDYRHGFSSSCSENRTL